MRTSGGAVQDYTISYQHLVPLTTYYFRVIAYNEFGISIPCASEETVGCLIHLLILLLILHLFLLHLWKFCV